MISFTLPTANPCLVNVKVTPVYYLFQAKTMPVSLFPSETFAIDCLPEVLKQ